MKYAERSSTCDVCVCGAAEAGLECVGCDLPGHNAHDTDEMISHLRIHQAYGDHVPMRLIHRLEDDRADLDGTVDPHTCHEGPCALCDPDEAPRQVRRPASVSAARAPE